MSESDYKRGMQGLPWASGSNREDYEAGKSVYDAKQRILGAGSGGPKTEVSGPGLVGVIMAPILALMYPIAGLIVLAAILIAARLIDLLPENHPFVRLGFMIAVALAALFPALKAEHKVSEFKPYRIGRHVFRLIAVGLLTFGAIIGAGRDTALDTAFNQASGGAIFAGLAAVVLMAWLFPKFDRVFFPVMDDHAKAEAKKYAGLSDEEIYAIKNRNFRGKLLFAGTWLAATVGVMFLIPHVSVFLIAAGCFAVCYILRNALFFKKQPVTSRTT